MTDPRLHPETVAFMEKTAALNIPAFGEVSAEELRAETDRRNNSIPPAIEPVRKVVRRKIDGPGGETPLRIYVPANAEPPYPVINGLPRRRMDDQKLRTRRPNFKRSG